MPDVMLCRTTNRAPTVAEGGNICPNLQLQGALLVNLLAPTAGTQTAGTIPALRPTREAQHTRLEQCTLDDTETLTQAGFQECPRSAIRIQMVIWFPEFCKSQCISHFAAPFLNVRAKTSVTESFRRLLAMYK